MNLNDWLNALDRMNCYPRKMGSGYKALCPSHDDKNPSLSIQEGDDGRVLAKCFAGCTFQAIRDALGLTQSNGHKPLAPPKATTTTIRPHKPPKPPPKPQPLPSGAGITVYHYVDGDGAPSFAVVRRDPRKRFSQWTPVGNDLWIPVSIPNNRPLYRLPDVLKGKGRVAVVEGEKCVAAAAKAWPEQIVTTWAGGTNAPHLTDWTPLAGREVSLLADADPLNKEGISPGHKAMQNVAAILHDLGCKVKIALPPIEWNSDVADWIESDGVDATAQRIAGLLQDYVHTEKT